MRSHQKSNGMREQSNHMRLHKRFLAFERHSPPPHPTYCVIAARASPSAPSSPTPILAKAPPSRGGKRALKEHLEALRFKRIPRRRFRTPSTVQYPRGPGSLGTPGTPGSLGPASFAGSPPHAACPGPPPPLSRLSRRPAVASHGGRVLTAARHRGRRGRPGTAAARAAGPAAGTPPAPPPST